MKTVVFLVKKVRVFSKLDAHKIKKYLDSIFQNLKFGFFKQLITHIVLIDSVNTVNTLLLCSKIVNFLVQCPVLA